MAACLTVPALACGGDSLVDGGGASLEPTTAGDLSESGSDDGHEPRCGDGILEADEECDRGPANHDQGACTKLCTNAVCGDGFVYAGHEACDDGNLDGNDACTPLCEVARCGDGFVYQGFEACDDGNDDDTDACSRHCTLTFCGDGLVQEGEACDDGNAVETDHCLSNCALPVCGDGFVYDSSDLVGWDLEACDDGNDNDHDDCTNACQHAVCGDGIVREGKEECDDGNDSNTDACTDECRDAFCGDLYLWEGVEVCDTYLDGCTDTCESTYTCDEGFTVTWCPQAGTKDQFTRCAGAWIMENPHITVCRDPEIRYGNTEGGIPLIYGDPNFDQWDTWCHQLGFGDAASAASTNGRACDEPQGGVYGCTFGDEIGWHWCDKDDYLWYNGALGFHDCDNQNVTVHEIRCKLD